MTAEVIDVPMADPGMVESLAIQPAATAADIEEPPPIEPTTTVSDEDADEDEEGILSGLPTMTHEELKKVAVEHGGYSTAHLNDTLYLHFKGYRRIENLEEYTGLKALWLHSNGFGKIENLSHLQNLRCLFLQRNALTKIEGLDALTSLVQLDLSENNIKHISGLSQLPNLTTLNLSKNALQDAESIIHLQECKALTAIDLSKNELKGKEVVDCLAGIPKVSSLNLAGNPVVSKLAFFRKKMIVACKSLRYLDRPIFDNERAAAEAWAQGGLDAEREAKDRLLQTKRDKERQAIEDFRAWQATVRHDGAPRYEVDGGEIPTAAPASSVANVPFEEKEVCDEAVERPFIEILEDEEEPATEETDVSVTNEPAPAVPPASSDPIDTAKTSVIIAPLSDRDAKKVSFQEPVEPTLKACAAPVKNEESDEPVVELEEPPAPPATEKENIQPQEGDEVEIETIEAGARRIRDSIAILKSSKRNNANMMTGITMGWTSELEMKLMKLVEEHNHDFEIVAAKMADGCDSKHIVFDSNACYRRFTLLNLGASKEEFQCPTTDKSLSYFSTDGERKSIDEIRLAGDGSSPRIMIDGLPGMNDLDEETDGAVLHRDEWERLNTGSLEMDR